MTRPDHAIDAYLEGQLTDEQARAIDQWIAADPANAKAFLHLARTHQMLSILGKENKLARETSAIKPESIDHATLASLAEMEASAETTPQSMLDLPFSFPPAAEVDPSNPGSLSAQDYIKAARYALHLVFTSKPAKKFYGRVAVAAGLLLAVTLLVVFTRDAPSESNDTVADLDFWDDIDTSTPPAVAPGTSAVATLTATHNAQWDSQPAEDLRRGSKLHPNQRLTLTAGFAEITTARGAVAILEAPATIELIDSDNALRLHAGKLVGICETDSSQGFLVRTPHMDITDLGTRFGINADTDETEVHVFEGKVQAERVDAAPGTEATLLAANMSARTSAGAGVIASIDHAAERFTALLPRTILLPGTGQGVAVGQTDTNWHVIAVDGKPLADKQELFVNDSRPYTRLVPNTERSKWISWNPEIFEDHVCTFQTKVTLPDDINPATASIAMRYYADAQVQAITVNGHRLALDPGAPVFGTWPEYTEVIDSHLQAGENTIELEIANLQPEPGKDPASVGLNLEWKFTNQPAWRAPAEE